MVNINECSVMRLEHLCASGSVEAENNIWRKMEEYKEYMVFLVGQDAVEEESRRSKMAQVDFGSLLAWQRSGTEECT